MKNEDCLVIFDSDCILDSIDHRSQLGIEMALLAWPSLKEEKESLLQDPTWLRNKLAALAHVFHEEEEEGQSNTCNFALAARLLLEEQALDEGESINKKGKYASKFHPQGMNTTANESTAKSSSTGTRPLTVGEIAANWESLRETLQIRYHCKYQDPMPILQSILDEIVKNQTSDFPSLYPEILHTVTSSRYQNSNIIMTVKPSDQLIITSSLKQADVNFQAVNTAKEAVEVLMGKKETTLIVLESRSKSCIIQDLLQSFSGDMLVVVQSSWKKLSTMVELFGDSIPRQDNIGNTPFGCRLSLNLASWGLKANPTFAAQATMNPWTDIINWERLQDEFLAPADESEENVFQ